MRGVIEIAVVAFATSIRLGPLSKPAEWKGGAYPTLRFGPTRMSYVENKKKKENISF
jgi:hypothetical protein